jgi:tetratricopeptide (TPR) repeat protein
MKQRALVLALVAVCLATTFAAVAGPAAAVINNCTVDRGQALIEAGRYDQAVREFSCVVDAHPTEIDGYRGRMEANALRGRYAAALDDNGRITAYVLPVHPDAKSAVFAGYSDRLATNPGSISALTGLTFFRWSNFDYPQTVQVANQLLEVAPNNLTGTLLRGSSRPLKGITTNLGVADLDHAIVLAPTSADVRFVVADAYTYGLWDPQRAFAEASRALEWGLDTPRVHAILATTLDSFGEIEQAVLHIQEHFDAVTTEVVTAPSLAPGDDLALDLVPGRVYDIPVPAVAGQPIQIATSSKDFWDTIALLIAPDGEPVVGSDDENAYFAAFDYVPQETGTYHMLVTSFEAINTGVLDVSRG